MIRIAICDDEKKILDEISGYIRNYKEKKNEDTKTEIDLKNIYVRNVRIIGSTLRSRTPAMKAKILEGIVRDVYPKIESGEVKPTIHAVLPIQKAEEAHDILYRGENVGKVVLTV